MVKEGNGEIVEEYRGITLMTRLMTTAYKIYAKVLAERLREEMVGNRKNTGESGEILWGEINYKHCVHPELYS